MITDGMRIRQLTGAIKLEFNQLSNKSCYNVFLFLRPINFNVELKKKETLSQPLFESQIDNKWDNFRIVKL